MTRTGPWPLIAPSPELQFQSVKMRHEHRPSVGSSVMIQRCLSLLHQYHFPYIGSLFDVKKFVISGSKGFFSPPSISIAVGKPDLFLNQSSTIAPENPLGGSTSSSPLTFIWASYRDTLIPADRYLRGTPTCAS